jgi:oligoendopeptidase F
MGPLDDIQGILDLLDNHWGTCYVRYVYALGYSASQDFARRLLGREPNIQATYRRFLGRARAHYPIDALKEAGVDFTTPGPFQASMRDFAAKVDQFERLLKQVR